MLSKKTILIAKSEYSKINEGFNGIDESFKNDGFEVVRVMCQDVYVPEVNDATTAAYTNSLILNDHVYVPMAVKGYGKYGREALEVDENAMQNH